MKIRIVSDLHLDINKREPLEIKDDIFTVIAGDISGDPQQTIQWVKQNINYGLFIAGNHICYNKYHKSIIELKKIFKQEFTLTNNVSFLENEYKIINNKVFIGCTLYTDYLYKCPPHNFTQQENTLIARKNLNDFTWGYYSEAGKLIKLTPKHYLIEFKKSLKFLQETIETFKDKQCIVITHHAPSPQNIDSRYTNDILNASYISDLEKFIINHKNISHWVSGHIHTSTDYMIGNTRLLCNARGYVQYTDNTKFNKNLLIEV